MTMKRILPGLLLLLLLPLAGWAEEPVVTAPQEPAVAAPEEPVVTAPEEPVVAAPEEPAVAAPEKKAVAAPEEKGVIYVIQKGDTLWGISERFIKDPYYWPNLWANNPFVTNPHLIYPGQKVRIYEGRLEIVPAGSDLEEVLPAEETPGEEVAGVVPSEEAAPPLEPRETITVKVVGGGEGFVTAEEISDAGLLVDTVDNRIMMAAGDTVFVTLKNLGGARAGDLFSVFRADREVKHPVTDKSMGFRVVELGTVRLLEVNEEVATAKIVTNHREMVRGDRLIPYKPARREVSLRRSGTELSGVIISARDDKLALGQNDHIYVDLGERQGIQKGNLLYISRPRRATELALAKNVKLPDRLLGAAVVVEVRPGTATALVLKSADAIERGDRVFTMVK